ncbi:DUF1194 domain-containing protein [Methylobrevis pamukkalensis]|uniref:DUF1194 domain-containing protein n=1 Tax=Methylobrevis pamukkalensis TaxID=1439726 RepID=A0A1E3GWK9_9HYPH|nr:DUF1194 domain-containing protein [Methylobrevis pamukkalensis]ODN68442.1 hypothetical protein A6302_04259 [Methylobrevis pamukkalensis]
MGQSSDVFRRRVGDRSFLAAVAAILAGLWTEAAQAADTEVDLELVLAVDVSRSMDYEEQMLQRQGYIEAVTDPEVMDAIRSGLTGRIAISYFEWAGPGQQRLAVPWQLVEDRDSARAFAAKIGSAQLSMASGTSISNGLSEAALLFDDNGFTALRRVIDISGDGPNNRGGMVEPVRDRVVASGIVINGLPIMLKPGGYSPYSIEDLDVYYRDCVIGGPGAFLVPVRDTSELIDAIRRKLILEIASAAPAILKAQAITPVEKTMDCLIGEKIWRRYMDP